MKEMDCLLKAFRAMIMSVFHPSFKATSRLSLPSVSDASSDSSLSLSGSSHQQRLHNGLNLKSFNSIENKLSLAATEFSQSKHRPAAAQPALAFHFNSMEQHHPSSAIYHFFHHSLQYKLSDAKWSSEKISHCPKQFTLNGNEEKKAFTIVFCC